jgi:hypothetical protein
MDDDLRGLAHPSGPIHVQLGPKVGEALLKSTIRPIASFASTAIRGTP